jgi:hypothetical protein
MKSRYVSSQKNQTGKSPPAIRLHTPGPKGQDSERNFLNSPLVGAVSKKSSNLNSSLKAYCGFSGRTPVALQMVLTMERVEYRLK